MKQSIAKALVAGAAGIMGLVGLTAMSAPVALAAGFNKTQTTVGINVEGEGDLVSASQTDTDAPLLKTFKKIVNWVLGLLGFIALCVALWGGFQMLSAAGDDAKYKKGTTILRQALIGLLFIGIAGLLVKTIMWVIGFATTA
jgi:Type IV secretion system pilin